MITPKDIENRTMNPEKEREAKNDFFAFYIGRPLSYIITIPFLYTNISPNTISLISIIPLVIGFILMSVGKSRTILIVGWLFFFLWNLIDGVDGNIARYKNQFSKMGSVYDAMSGYMSMVLSFFAWGCAASHNPGLLAELLPLESDIYIILGAFSGIFQIFPRLIMHKAISTNKNDVSASSIKDKSKYGLIEIVALNLTSVAGGLQIFMLIAVLFDLLGLFTICYFILNFIVMLVSLLRIFKGKE